MANYGGNKRMRSAMMAGKKLTPAQRRQAKNTKPSTFKPCAGCPTPTACRRAGKCLKKRMMGQR